MNTRRCHGDVGRQPLVVASARANRSLTVAARTRGRSLTGAVRTRCRSLTVAVLIGCLALLSGVTVAWAGPGDVQRTLDSPSKYPAGLATDGTHLYVLDWREAQVHQVAVADGGLVRTFAAPTLRPHGLACSGDTLYVSDDGTGRVFALRLADGRVTGLFDAPGPRAVGLAYAGDALFLLEGRSGRIYKVMPEDGTILRDFAAPTPSSTHLAWDGTYLWVADRVKDEIYLVEPKDGHVLGIVTAPGPYPAGLAWLDGHLWNVDFQTRKLYQLVVRDDVKYQLREPRRARVEYLWTLYNYGPGDLLDLTVHLALPPKLPAQELLSEIQLSDPPTEMVVDRYDQRCAAYRLARVAAGTRLQRSYHVEAQVSAIRYLVFPEQAGTLTDIPPEIREKYTADGSRYRIDSPFIRKTVQEVVGDETNCYWIARKVYNHVIDRLEYEMVGGWDVPEVVLKRGTGSCSEYTFAFIALCRAAGLPARYQGSVVVRGDDASIDEAHHRWAEIYLPNYGWVPVDANRGDAKLPADQARGFGELSNRFLITTQSGGGSECLAWSYNAFAQYQATGYCRVDEVSFGFWEPLGPTDKETVPEQATIRAGCQP